MVQRSAMRIALMVVGVMILCCWSFGAKFGFHDPNSGRSLLQHPGIEVRDCAAHRVIEYWEREFGGHYVEFIFLVYLFFGIAVVIDTHFVVTLEHIAESLKLPGHVVGATFLSLGNASPEIVVSLVSSVSHGEVETGLGMVIGACMFNLLVCVGVAIMGAEGHVFSVHMGATVRDLVSYLLILALVVGMFLSGKATLGMSLLLTFSFPVFAVCMIAYYVAYPSTPEDGVVEDATPHDTEPLLNTKSPHVDGGGGGGGTDENEPNNHSSESPASVILLKAMNILAWPWQALFNLLFFKRLAASTYATFVVSLLCIGLLSYLVVVLVRRLECGFEISGAMIGLTVLAIGVATPDVFSNRVVASKGFFDMALSACMGSNVVAMSLGLGLSWTVLNLRHGEAVKLNAKGIKAAILILVLTFVVFSVSIVGNGFQLTQTHAYVYFVMYLAFLGIIISGVLNDHIPESLD